MVFCRDGRHDFADVFGIDQTLELGQRLVAGKIAALLMQNRVKKVTALCSLAGMGWR